MLTQRRRRWPKIISQLGQCRPTYPVIRVVAFLGINRQCTGMAVRANTSQSPSSVSMLGQRRVRLTGIESAMGSDAGPTLNR